MFRDFRGKMQTEQQRHEALDNLTKKFLNVLPQKYLEKFYHLQLTESKTRSVHLVLQKKKRQANSNPKKDVLKMLKLFLILYTITFALSEIV